MESVTLDAIRTRNIAALPAGRLGRFAQACLRRRLGQRQKKTQRPGSERCAKDAIAKGEAYRNRSRKRSMIDGSGSSSTTCSSSGASMGAVEMTNCTSLTLVFFGLVKLTGT